MYSSIAKGSSRVEATSNSKKIKPVAFTEFYSTVCTEINRYLGDNLADFANYQLQTYNKSSVHCIFAE